MARIRVFIVLVLAVTAGGGLALGTYNYIQKAQVRPASMPLKQVVVSKANLDVGADLTKDDVKAIEWPAASVPTGAGSAPEATNAAVVCACGLPAS